MEGKRPYYAVFQSYDNSGKTGFKPKRPSRINNFRVGNEPGFRCPRCEQSFKLKYGVNGKMETFETPTLYCLDCSEKPKFTKMD